MLFMCRCIRTLLKGKGFNLDDAVLLKSAFGDFLANWGRRKQVETVLASKQLPIYTFSSLSHVSFHLMNVGPVFSLFDLFSL